MTPGLRIGRYEVGNRLGKGSFGVVHLARDSELGREVAIKFLRPEFSTRDHIVQRFLQEARAAAKIGHPGIVTVFECGMVNTGGRSDTAYIVMERLLGESLGERIAAKQPWPYAKIVAIGRQLAIALAAAHGSGIIHRDLKPDNVFLVPDAAVVGGERAKILDFGIAKLDDPGPGGIHTHSKMILGTPRYMSPEQARSSTNVDTRTDIYALGCMLYELVCGRTPFEGDSGDIMLQHQTAEVPRASTLVDNVPPALDALLDEMLQKQPDRRPASMQAVDAALAALDNVPGVPAVRARARFVERPIHTDVVEPPRPKRISAAGELSTKTVDHDPPTRPSAGRIEVNIDAKLDAWLPAEEITEKRKPSALTDPSEEHTVPVSKLVQLARTSEPTFRAVAEPTLQLDRSADERRPTSQHTLATRRGLPPNAIWIVAAVGVLLLLGLAMALRCGGKGARAELAHDAESPGLAEAPDPAEHRQLARDCEAARLARDWDALEACGKAQERLAAGTGRATLDVVQLERAAEVGVRALAHASHAGNLEAARRAAASILERSVFHAEVAQLLEAAERKYVADQITVLDAIAGKHDCEAHREALAGIAQQFGTKIHAAIKASATPCSPAVEQIEMAEVRRSVPSSPDRRPSPPPPPVSPECADTGKLDQLERRAADAMDEGAYAAARAAYDRILACRPKLTAQAYLAACRAHGFERARQLFKQLGSKDQFAQICLREGFDPRK